MKINRLNNNRSRIYVSWCKESSRSESTAHHFNAEAIFVYPANNILNRFIIIRYLVSSIQTIFILIHKRPLIIFVMAPPTLPVALIYLYSLFSRANYIIDTHSGVFSKKWKTFLPFHKFFAQKSLVNIVHNSGMERRIKKLGGRTIILGDVPRILKSGRNFQFRTNFNIVFVCSHHEDEPLSEMLQAAKNLSDIDFYFTGSPHPNHQSNLFAFDTNIHFTGFLPWADYVALIKGCNIIVCLTKNPDTTQNGAFEAIALERPIITSNWKVLKEVYFQGTKHIDNSANELIHAITAIRSNYNYFLNEIKELKYKRTLIWENNYRVLTSIIKRYEDIQEHAKDSVFLRNTKI